MEMLHLRCKAFDLRMLRRRSTALPDLPHRRARVLSARAAASAVASFVVVSAFVLGHDMALLHTTCMLCEDHDTEARSRVRPRVVHHITLEP